MSRLFTKKENQDWQRKQPAKTGSACVAITHEGKALMVKATYKDYWSFPSGGIDEGESPLDAALRETQEEIGVGLERNKVTILTTIYTYPENGFLDRYNFVFLTEVADKEILNFKLNEKEIETVEWVPFDQIAERSKQRGSYKKIQEILVSHKSQFYAEV